MESLPVLMPDSRLARLVVKQVHGEDHRKDLGSLLASSRRLAWIVGARRLVKSIVKLCMRCRVRARRRSEQVMGELTPETVEQSRPFQYVILDLLGPLMVRGMGPDRRRTFKAWAVVIVCASTKALSIWPLQDYSTRGFMTAFTCHTSIYGNPSLVTSDQGSQLKGAAGEMPDWATVQFQTAPTGTAWRFVPPQAPWRVGLAERMVGLLKRSLSLQLNAGELLNYAQLGAALLRIASILNGRLYQLGCSVMGTSCPSARGICCWAAPRT